MMMYRGEEQWNTKNELFNRKGQVSDSGHEMKLKENEQVKERKFTKVTN